MAVTAQGHLGLETAPISCRGLGVQRWGVAVTAEPHSHLSASQSVMLQIAATELEKEESRRESEKQNYLSEHCPPLHIPGSMSEVQVVPSCHIPPKALLPLFLSQSGLVGQDGEGTGVLKSQGGHPTAACPPRNFANNCMRRLTWLRRRNTTWR